MKRLLFLTTLIFAAPALLAAQNAVVAFYNVENLFDTINDPAKDDGDFTPRGRYHWSSESYNAKIKNISSVMAMLRADLIGLAEIENTTVLDDLIDTEGLGDYNYVHFESRDPRGIDVALIYNVDNVELMAVEQLRYRWDAPYYSRDILYVQCKLHGEEVHVLVCHLPSVTSRKKYRKAAARSVNRYVKDISGKNPDAKIIVMGDFNADTSGGIMSLITENAPSGRTLHNPFSKLSRRGYGSYMYRGRWHMYDAILINDNMMNGNGLHYTEGNARIFIRDFLIQREGRFKGYPFRAISNDRFSGGYSDHLPVCIDLTF